MLVPLETQQAIWQQIKQESMSSSTYRVVVFVACMNVDALAAAHMLGALLRKHLILYKIRPVVGYTDLQSGYKRLDDSVRNVILVGCGSNVDLDELLALSASEGVRGPKIHVFDCVRPWNLNNLFGSEQIYCYDDGSADKLEPFRVAYDYLAMDLEQNESDLENDESPNQPSAKKRRLVDDDDDDDDENDEVDEDDTNEDEDLTDNSNRPANPRHDIETADQDGTDTESQGTQEDDVPADPAEINAKKRKVSNRKQFLGQLEDYYRQGSHLSVTNSIQIYTLLTLIGETSLPALWLAVIGLTAVEAQHPQLYRLLLPSLRNEMMRLNTNHDLSMGSSANASNTNSKSDLGMRAIKFYPESDYSLFMLRQWSLYESMIHSAYVSAKLFLWREDGRRKLHKLLARMGITLQDSKESWIHTSPHLKRELRAKLSGVQTIYGLDGILRDGAVRQFGLKGVMSAGDCVEALAAYLETGLHDLQLNKDQEETTDSVAAKEERWVSHFWSAWDAVDNYDKLHQGTERAKQLQQAVVATANYIFDKNIPKDLHTFRMVIIQDAPEIAVFLNPLSLERLAVWISESCAELHNNSTPLVMAVLNEPENVYLVFGMAPQKTRDQPEQGTDIDAVKYNQFGRQFQETALEINARVRVDAFDSAIIEVNRDDLPRFLEALDGHID